MYKKGFTLIELLIVIAIIGILTAVILAALGSAKKKGNDSAIKQEVVQLRNLLELQYTTSGSYTPLFTGDWIPYSSLYDCTTFSYGSAAAFTAATVYASKATAICTNINKNSGSSFSLYILAGFTSGVATPGTFSIMAELSNKTNVLCLDNLGRSSTTLTDANINATNPNAYPLNPGCPNQASW